MKSKPRKAKGAANRTKRSAGSQQRVVSWRRLPATATTKKGDRRIYADGMMGAPIYEIEIGMTAGATGYHAVARRVRKPANG